MAPLPSRTIVLRRGMENGLKVFREIGGHISPIETSGLREQWKNVQKKDAKKHTSLKINKIIPLFRPSLTSGVYSPLRPSPDTSFHQATLASTKSNVLSRAANILPYLKNTTKEVKRLKTETLLIKGQPEYFNKCPNPKIKDACEAVDVF